MIDLGIAPWLVALAGLVALAYAIGAYKRKKLPLFDTDGKQRDSVMWVGIVLAGILLLGSTGGPYILDQLQGAGVTGAVVGSGGGSSGQQQIQCNSQTSPTITVSGAVISNPSTAVASTATIAYREKGTSAWRSGFYGTGITAFAPGTVVQMELGNQSGTTGSYYTVEKELTVPCQQVVTVSQDLGLEATAANVALYYKNDQGSPSTAIDVAAGQTKTGYIVITGEYQHSFGDAECGANSNIMAVYYNRSQIQNIRIGSWAEVSCPGVVPTSTVANNVSKCFSAPVLTSDQTTGDVALTIQGDSSNNPAQDLRLVLFDSNRYRNTVTGEYVCGIGDNANADTGIASTTTPGLDIVIT